MEVGALGALGALSGLAAVLPAITRLSRTAFLWRCYNAGMIAVQVKADTAAMERTLDAIGRQMPFVVAKALTNTAQDVQRALRDAMLRQFDRPTPYTVGTTPCVLRSNNRTPTASSRSAMACDTVGWVVARCAAALAMLPCSATLANTRR